MSSILVFIQQSKSSLPKPALSVIAASQKIKEIWKCTDIYGVVLGDGASDAANLALSYGFKEVFFSENSIFSKYTASAYSSIILEVIKKNNIDVIIGPSSTTGKDLFPRIAASLDAGQASDIISVNDDGTLRRPMYAGDVLADVSIETKVKIITVRPSAFTPATVQGATGQKTEIAAGTLPQNMGEVVGYEESKSARPELTSASVIVSGGRALQSSENFEKVLFPLADTLGAAVGASRAAVDSGYAPNDWQVGQTGKVVAPDLYIAVGISGAIQHLAGMKDSKVIVAINKDPDAPIFEVADFGLVADLYQAVPELTEALQKVKNS